MHEEFMSLAGILLHANHAATLQRQRLLHAPLELVLRPAAMPFIASAASLMAALGDCTACFVNELKSCVLACCLGAGRLISNGHAQHWARPS